MTSPAHITIAQRFNGPVASGNGGYTAGLAAALLSAQATQDGVEATLRAPIPLGRPLAVHRTDDGLTLVDAGDGDTLILSLRHVGIETPVIRSPGLAAAARAATQFRDVEDHVLPTCFVCGPARAPGDGLRIFTDWVAQDDNPNPFPIVAAPWTPGIGLTAADGYVAPEYVWAALDCPGAFAIDAEPILLGRMTARVIELPVPGEPCVAVAWKTGVERRKHFAATALFGADDRLLAFSQQTWIQIDAHAHQKDG